MVRAIFLLLVAAAASAESNKDLARRYFTEVWIGGQAARATDFLAPKVRVADARGGAGVEQSAEQQVELIRNLCVESSDCSQSRVLSQIAEGDTVATVWVLRARPKTMLASLLARVFGAGQVDRRVVTILDFSAGKIVGIAMQRDDLGVYADLGLVNAGMVVLYGFGGLSGLLLAWTMRRSLRK